MFRPLFILLCLATLSASAAGDDGECFEYQAERFLSFVASTGSRPISDARVVLIGNKHTDRQQQLDMQDVVNAQGRDGDIVLLEGRYDEIRADLDRVAIPRRNRSLMRTLDATIPLLRPGQKIFVFGGSNHFAEPELLRHLQGTSFIVLAPGEDSLLPAEALLRYFNRSARP